MSVLIENFLYLKLATESSGSELTHSMPIPAMFDIVSLHCMTNAKIDSSY